MHASEKLRCQGLGGSEQNRFLAEVAARPFMPMIYGLKMNHLGP